jgi:hypothetical protein
MMEVLMPSYEELTQRAGSLRAMTGLTAPEFTALLPYFEHAFLVCMEDHAIDGQPRISRRYSAYDTSPLPTMADKLLFILTYLKQNPIQEVQGQLLAMSQANVNKWMHLLQTVLNQAIAQQELLPARTSGEFAALLTSKRTKEEATSPLVGMMALSDPSIAHEMPRSSRSITVVRSSATRSQTSS